MQNAWIKMQRLYLNTGLETPRDPPVRAGQCGPGKGSLGPPAWAAPPATRPRISGRRWDEMMRWDERQNYYFQYNLNWTWLNWSCTWFPIGFVCLLLWILQEIADKWRCQTFVQPTDALICELSKREPVGSPFTCRILQYYDFYF